MAERGAAGQGRGAADGTNRRDSAGGDAPTTSDDADRLPLTRDQIAALTAVTAGGGLVVFPAETVYGLATDPDDADAVRRMAELKRRDPGQPSSVLFWSVEDAVAALAGAPDAVVRAVRRLLPGPIGLIVPNPGRRFAPACGDDPASLGIRVPRREGFADTATEDRNGADGARDGEGTGSAIVAPPIVQTSANLAGGPDPRTLAAVPDVVREGADLLIDAGPRPGTPSTIVDLRGVTDATPDGWHLVRAGPVTVATIATALAAD